MKKKIVIGIISFIIGLMIGIAIQNSYIDSLQKLHQSEKQLCGDEIEGLQTTIDYYENQLDLCRYDFSNFINQDYSWDCDWNKFDCGDFDSQYHAQLIYDYCIKKGMGDINKLDRDKDGIACELN